MRITALSLLLAGTVWGAALGCVPDFAPAQKLGDAPRVVAVQAAPPEVAPGGRVMLRPLLHAPKGPLHVAYLVCTADPLGASENCVADALEAGAALAPCGADNGSLQPVCVATGDATALVRVPEGFQPVIPDAEGVPVESILQVELVVSPDPEPLSVCAGAVAAVRPEEDCLLAVKRVRVSTRDRPNQNPAIAALSVGGVWADASELAMVSAPASGVADLAVPLVVRLDPASVDDAVNPAGEPDETFLDLLWYADCGSMEPDSARIRCDPGAVQGDLPLCEEETVTWKPGETGICTVYAVVYDGRGGVGWWRQAVQVGAGR